MTKIKAKDMNKADVTASIGKTSDGEFALILDGEKSAVSIVLDDSTRKELEQLLAKVKEAS